jgi:hypothetical protein
MATDAAPHVLNHQLPLAMLAIARYHYAHLHGFDHFTIENYLQDDHAK